MRSGVFAFCHASVAAGLLAACDNPRSLEPARGPGAPQAQRGGIKNANTFATLTTLPALSRGVYTEAYAVDRAGSVIAGYSRDRTDRMNPVTWTQQNGAWTITALPYPASATSAVARSVNDAGDVAGNDFPASTPHALLWPVTGGYEVLGCGELGEVFGMSAGGRVVVGVHRHVAPAVAALWQPGNCREDLLPLFPGGSASALAVNGDGTIVGGSARPDAQSNFLVPVRWKRIAGAWQIDQLDSRAGTVFGANAAGDLVGTVSVSCASAGSRAPAIRHASRRDIVARSRREFDASPAWRRRKSASGPPTRRVSGPRA